MRHLAIEVLRNRPSVLCIGAHCDDIEIGCSATLMRLAREYQPLEILWAVFSGEPDRQAETRAAAARLQQMGVSCTVRFFSFETSFFPAHYASIKGAMESLRLGFEPGLVMTHRLEDRHQDHELLARLSWNTFRQHMILEYEIPKYEGDLGHPNVFFPISKADLDHKVSILMDCFPSQQDKGWFTAETFRAIARIRGIESAAETGYAEAFHARKLSL